jgi:hypothetical protein
LVSLRTAAQVLTDIGAQASLTNPVTGTGAAGRVAFWTGTNTQSGDAGLFWDNTNKRLGIGTTSPTAPLDTNGVRIGRNFSISNRATVRLDSNGVDNPADILFGHTSAANQTSWTGVYWSLSSRGGSDENKFHIYRGAGNPSGLSELILFTIQPNGNVGIGTTNPTANLDVKTAGGFTRGLRIGPQNTTTGDGSYIEFNTSTIDGYGPQIGGVRTGAGAGDLIIRTGLNTQVERFRIQDGGNVGIGTTTPSQKLHLSGASTGLRITDTNITNASFNTLLIKAPGQNKFSLGVNSLTSENYNLTIDGSNGNVGIGTISPNSLLHLQQANIPRIDSLENRYHLLVVYR